MRAILRFVFESLIRLFFPSIVVKGNERIPTGVPLVFVMNHPNGLLDPVVLRVGVRRPIGFLAKSTLFKNPIGRFAMSAYGAIPVYRRKDVGAGGGDPSRNEETFALCRQALARGESLALFPEGVSHADAQLKPLKTGAARIVLSSEHEHAGKLGVMIVPVGLAYSDPSVFRSRALLVVGEPIAARDVYDDYVRDERGAVDALTDRIKERLDEVVVQAESRELLEGVARVAVWTAEGPEIRRDAVDQQERTRELLRAYTALRASEPERVAAIVDEAQAYTRALALLGVTDPWAMEVGHVGVVTALRVFVKLAVLAPAAVVGAALGWVPYRLAGRVAARVAKEEDLLGTMKLLAGTLLLCVAWAVEASVAGWLWGTLAAFLVLCAGPATGYAALRFDETREVAIEALRHAWVRHRYPSAVAAMADRRRALATDVARALRVSV